MERGDVDMMPLARFDYEKGEYVVDDEPVFCHTLFNYYEGEKLRECHRLYGHPGRHHD